MGIKEFAKSYPVYADNMGTYWYSLSKWLDGKGARVVGKVDGRIILVFEEQDFEKLREEIFSNIKEEDKNEVDKSEKN